MILIGRSVKMNPTMIMDWVKKIMIEMSDDQIIALVKVALKILRGLK